MTDTAAPPAVVGAGGLSGEEALHGSRAEWLALVGGGAEDADEAVSGGWTLLFLQPGEHADPWFLRVKEYPGVGPALAWDARLPLPEGGRLERRLRVAVRDGRTDGAGELAALAEAARELP